MPKHQLTKQEKEDEYCGALLDLRDEAERRGLTFRESVIDACERWIKGTPPMPDPANHTTASAPRPLATRPGEPRLEVDGLPIVIEHGAPPADLKLRKGWLKDNAGLIAAMEKLVPGAWLIVPGSAAWDKKKKTTVTASLKKWAKDANAKVAIGWTSTGLLVRHNEVKGQA